MVEFGVRPDCALIFPENSLSKSSLFSCSVEDPVKAMMLLFSSGSDVRPNSFPNRSTAASRTGS